MNLYLQIENTFLQMLRFKHNPNIGFLKLFKLYINYYKNPPLKEEIKEPGTLKNYSVKQKTVHEFLSKKKSLRIRARDFKIGTAKSLYEFMRDYSKNDHASRTVSLCRAVLNFGVNHEIIKVNNLYMFSIKKDKPKKPVYLLPEEITAIETHAFQSEALKKAADLFLFQCYTGFDYGDLMNVSPDHIVYNGGDQRYYVVKPRNKSDVEACVPYFDKIKAIWERYNFSIPQISNSTYGRFLKEIGAILNINKNFNPRLARKTFFEIMLNHKGYSLEAVSKMGGHARVETTEKYYVRVNMNLVSKEVSRVEAMEVEN